MADATYIHGTDPAEQERLALLNRLTNPPFIEFLALRGDERILEVGSGLGILAAEVAQRVPRGSVTGLECSPDQLARAPRGVRNLAFVQGDAHALPFGDGSFDLVYGRYLLEHVADPGRVLREARRVLDRGGRMLAQENDISLVRHDPPTPSFDLVWARFAELQHRLGGDARIGTKLHRLFRAAGFRDVRLSAAPEIYAHGDAAFAPWVRNLIGNITSGARALAGHGLATPAQIAGAVADLEALIANPDASTWFHWNRAAATA
jgi:SAM-dependent methyltransferase